MMSLKINLFYSLFLFVALNINATEDLLGQSLDINPKEEYRINVRYKAGKTLIYDCELQHFACVNKDSEELCKNISGLENYQKACWVIEHFENKETCVLKQYTLQENSSVKKICIKKN